MTDKVQKIREEVEKLHKVYRRKEGAFYYRKALRAVLFIIDSLQEESVSDRFAFKAIPRLLEMIEPTDRAKAYIAKLADTLEVEGYSTDAKIVRESLKIMNGEKVPMATMNSEPVSEELEEVSKEWLRPQLDKSYANYGETKMMELTHFDGYAMLDAIEFGAKWGKNQAKVEIQAQSMAFAHGCPKEEPVSDDLEEEIDNYVKRNGYDGLDSIEEVKYIANHFAKWQKTKDESITEDLGEYINELSKQFPEVSFAKLSRIAVRVANWKEAKDQESIETAIHHAYHNGRLKMKEQMIAKAIDGEILEIEDNDCAMCSHTHLELFIEPDTLEKNCFKDNDKVKVILIKED